jgi:hypothetical protein
MAAFLAILRCCFDLDELAMFPRPIKEYDWENTTIEKNDIILDLNIQKKANGVLHCSQALQIYWRNWTVVLRNIHVLVG